MTEDPFPTHRQAALALLHHNRGISANAARFLGQITVDPSPLSENQAFWLVTLLNRAGLPPMSNDAV